MLITSSAFQNNTIINKKFTCDGWNINPELLIQYVPEEAKSLALVIDDPDSSSGIFTHWLLWNIDPKTEIIKEESTPPGSMEGKNSSGQIGYFGPCPSPGKSHRYRFQLYALSKKLDLPEGATKDELAEEIEQYSIAKAELVGLYGR